MASRQTRIAFIDNLRWAVVLTVVGMHAAVTYSHVGSWYYNAPEAPGPAAMLFFILFQVHLQAFFMGFMFLLAGYFVPRSYDRKGFYRFVADRLVRLGIPSLIYVFVIHPLMGYFLLGWWTLSLPSAYWQYLTSGHWLSGTGPMWFAVALLIFSCLYALARAALPWRPTRPPQTATPYSGAILVTGLTIAGLAYVLRIEQPIGTSLYNMQIGFFAQYCVLFIAGILAGRRDWLCSVPRALGYRLLILALLAGPVLLLVLGRVVKDTGATLASLNGGASWPSAAFALWESMFCVAVCTGLAVLFRERINFKGSVTGLLSDDSFGVYWLHPPVLVAISLAMAPLTWQPVWKFLLLWMVAYAATLAMVHVLVRRLPYGLLLLGDDTTSMKSNARRSLG